MKILRALPNKYVQAMTRSQAGSPTAVPPKSIIPDNLLSWMRILPTAKSP